MSQFEELPEGWELVEWKHIGLCQNGRAFPSKEYSADGVKLLRPGNLHESGKVCWTEENTRLMPEKWAKEYPSHLVKSNELVINLTAQSLKDDFLGRICLTNSSEYCLLNQRIARLTPIFIPNEYIFWLFKSPVFRRFVDSLNTGSLIQHMFTYQIDEFKLPLPPLNEQRRIVEKIEALTARSRKARAALDDIPALLDQFRQSVLAAAFRGDLTADWRAQNPDVEPAEALLERIRVEREEKATSTRDRSRLYRDWEELEVPSNFKVIDTWLKCSIGHIGNVCNGSTPSRKEDDYWGGSISWVSSGEVQNNIIFSTREKITEAGFKNSSGRILPAGTVLIAMIGEGKTRGQTAILKVQATINQNIAAVVLDHGLLSSQYLWHWFRCQYSETRRAGSGSGPQALNCQRVREMPFILPPLAEQEVIVERIDSLLGLTKNLEAQHQITQEDLEQLDRSILAKAFRGELVPQDPTDEPAAVLLDRIRAEREQQSSGKKRAKAKK